MSTSVVPISGTRRELDRKAEPDEQVEPNQVADLDRMARLLMSILRDVATLKRRFWPRSIDYEDLPVDGTGTTPYRFAHRFGARVRWYVVDWQGSGAPELTRDDSTDNDTLVLTSGASGTVTIRVEETK